MRERHRKRVSLEKRDRLQKEREASIEGEIEGGKCKKTRQRGIKYLCVYTHDLLTQ